MNFSEDSIRALMIRVRTAISYSQLGTEEEIVLSKQVPDALMQMPMPKVISLERKWVEGWKSGRAHLEALISGK